jgi:hypothetical protein
MPGSIVATLRFDCWRIGQQDPLVKMLSFAVAIFILTTKCTFNLIIFQHALYNIFRFPAWLFHVTGAAVFTRWLY